ncbi:MAG: YjbQ family protein [Eubacteriaceae bacterium]|nr:YjbQ family protein [Eubacteriaceae bacterium]
MKIIDIEITSNEQLIDITEQVKDYVNEVRLKDGFIHIQIPERTSAVTISINDDWRLEKEFFKKMNHLLPKYDGMSFTGWTTSNVKASIFGLTIQVMVQNGTLILDKNQSIYFVEFQGPGQRQCYMSTMGTNLEVGEEPKMPEFLRILHENRSDLKAEHERIQEEMRTEWRLKEELRLESEKNKNS